MKKRLYTKPLIIRTELDYSISLQMLSQLPPMDPMPRGGTQSPSNSPSPFQSPFGDKPFA